MPGEGPWGPHGGPRGMGPHGGPRGMGLKDPWASRTRASRTWGPLGDPGWVLFLFFVENRSKSILLVSKLVQMMQTKSLYNIS